MNARRGFKKESTNYISTGIDNLDLMFINTNGEEARFTPIKNNAYLHLIDIAMWWIILNLKAARRNNC